MNKKMKDNLLEHFTYLNVRQGVIQTAFELLSLYRQAYKHSKEYRQATKKANEDLDRLAKGVGNIEEWIVIKDGECYNVHHKDTGELVAATGVHNNKLFVQIYTSGEWASVDPIRELMVTSLVNTRLNKGIVMLPLNDESECAV